MYLYDYEKRKRAIPHSTHTPLNRTAHISYVNTLPFTRVDFRFRFTFGDGIGVYLGIHCVERGVGGNFLASGGIQMGITIGGRKKNPSIDGCKILSIHWLLRREYAIIRHFFDLTFHTSFFCLYASRYPLYLQKEI